MSFNMYRALVLTGVLLLLAGFCVCDKTLFVTESYFFPYMCSAVFGNEDHKTADWISACTILNRRWVAISVENINQPRPVFHWPYWYHLMDGIRIHAGSVFGIPEKLDRSLLGKLRYHQVKSVLKVEVPLDASFVFDDTKQPRIMAYSALALKDKDRAPNMTNDMTWNAIGGAEWGIGFLEVDFTDLFIWNAQILPAPLFETDSAKLAIAVRRHVEEMERYPESQRSCSVGAWDHKREKLLFYQVIHVPFDACQNIYCNYAPRGCLRFPRYEQHICFKSIIHGDLCPEDRGAALYCRDFNQSVLGLLTTAPNCGYQNLPSVYTLIHNVAKAFDGLKRNNPRDIGFAKIEDLSAYNLLPPR